MALVAWVGVSAVWAAAPVWEQTPRGAVVETERYRVTIHDGVVVGLRNQLTGEDYLQPTTVVEPLLRQIPAGLGTQNKSNEYATASKIYRWPWVELPLDIEMPNQHFATAKSKFTFEKRSETSIVLTYTGLTDGKVEYPDETYTIALEVDAATGDLLVTPAAKSPRTGVYAVNVVLARTRPDISIQAPIYDGIKLTSDMAESLWHNKWPDFWDYAFLAYEGETTGAIGVWAQDPELTYKDLFFRSGNRGVAIALSSMNTPPFEPLAEAKSVTWRIQAYDKSWSQAAKRFRDWRLANVKFAPRAEWTKHVAFVNSGVNAADRWLNFVKAYVGGENLDRTVTFAAVIRAAQFDTRHWDNTPYKGFKDDMPKWKESGAKLMAYLQPMIMWGSPPHGDEAVAQIYKLHQAANTVSTFSYGKGFTYVDQHHLGYKPWQDWILTWVNQYLREYGADGIYHDQSYPCPPDSRGLVSGMRSTQGMADYFYKAAAENPNSIHGTEHMQEANSVGASLGIGSGILWGTAPVMRNQRLKHPSPVSNSLHYPNGTLFAFPHYSDFASHGEATKFHWGMNQMEGRGDIAGLHLQLPFVTGGIVPFDQWTGDLKLDLVRSRLFVKHGIRPVYPEDWDRRVLTYFQGAKGEQFRYEKTPWGSRFVRTDGKAPEVQYGRAYGVRYAATEGAIAGWNLYNSNGPAGLNPDRYYFIDPNLKRPAIYFEPAFTVVGGMPSEPTLYEGFLDNGCGNDAFQLLRVQPLPDVGAIIGSDRVILNSPDAPKAVFVSGRLTPASKLGEGKYNVATGPSSLVVVLLKDLPVGLTDLKANALGRYVSSVNLDVFDSRWVTEKITSSEKAGVVTIALPSLGSAPGVPGAQTGELHVPFKAPDKAGTLNVKVTGGGPIKEILVNGIAQDVLKDPAKAAPIEVVCKPGDLKLVSIYTRFNGVATFEWVDAPPPVAK